MHFDDSLDTVLAGDISTVAAAQANWRQLVDLIGRGRAPAGTAALQRLAELRPTVPTAVRAASARMLAFADPPPALVALFAGDELAVAAPVLRAARIADAEWIALLPGLSPGGRAILRHRRDLSGEVARALAAFGPVDFQLDDRREVTTVADVAIPQLTTDARPAEAAPWDAEPALGGEQPLQDATPALASPDAPPAVEPAASPFVSVGAAALTVPAVAEALRSHRAGENGEGQGGFPIAELVERIGRFQRDREVPRTAPAHDASEAPSPLSESFRFETDAQGVVRWVAGIARAAAIGLALSTPAPAGGSGVDGAVAGAFRRRQAFRDARLAIGGASDAAGPWRISAVPAFDPASGRFTGYRGTGRRPRADEQAEPRRASSAADSLRQLVHELRTPATAISGFAEMIEGELLGPVALPYRERATLIRRTTESLLDAIGDLDTAARIESGALDLQPEVVALPPLLARIAVDLAPLAALRGTAVTVAPWSAALTVAGDARAIERLLGRLLATLVAVSARGERIGVAVANEGGRGVAITFDRPAALATFSGDALFAIDAESEGESGAPLLGTGFTLRLARNLARELGGGLAIGAGCLTLRLPAADGQLVGQIFSN